MYETGFWRGHPGGALFATGRGRNSLRKLINEDQVVAQRGKPSLPKLKFMEGLGPEDPRFETYIDDAGPVPDAAWGELVT